MQNNWEILLKRWYIFSILRHERPFEHCSQGYYRVIRNPQSLKVLNGSRIVRIYCKLYASSRKMLRKITILDEVIKIIYLVGHSFVQNHNSQSNNLTTAVMSLVWARPLKTFSICKTYHPIRVYIYLFDRIHCIS